MRSSFEEAVLGNLPNVYFIAEVGLNHNGSIKLARQIIEIAARAGADAVKFQKRTVSQLAVKDTLDQQDNRFPSFGRTYREIREHLEFNLDQYFELKDFALAHGLEFIVTPFDAEAISFLNPLDLLGYKVASHSVRNIDFLEALGDERKPVVMSTGMSTVEEIDEAVEVWRKRSIPFALLHCVSSYPTNDQDAHLRVIPTLKERYSVSIGYSGHEKDDLPTLSAVALGAKIIERHITVSRTLEGFDHRLSLDEKQLCELILKIRRVESLLGSREKNLLPCELIARNKYNVSMVSKRPLSVGHKLTQDDVTWKNPGTGISRNELNNYLGKELIRSVEADVLLNSNMFI